MLDKLIEIGFSDEELENIKEYINEDNKEDFLNNLNLLENIGCDIKEIKNILVTNPLFLNKMYSDVLELVNYLNELGFTNLNLLFDSYPLFLNKEKFEILEYIDSKGNMGLEDIVDELENNPLLIEGYYDD